MVVGFFIFFYFVDVRYEVFFGKYGRYGVGFSDAVGRGLAVV